MDSRFVFQPAKIAGVWLITVFNADDTRGSFTKDYSRKIFAAHGIEYGVAEVFYAHNRKGVLRGLHFQGVQPQPKLVRCLSGRIYDVVVDLRQKSPTFKEWLGVELTGDSNLEILIPSGCAHGYLAVEESLVSYKCAEDFYPEYDAGILWQDEEIDVKWPLEKIGGAEKLIISDKDRTLPLLKNSLAAQGL